jgi:hypothetical protein
MEGVMRKAKRFGSVLLALMLAFNIATTLQPPARAVVIVDDVLIGGALLILATMVAGMGFKFVDGTSAKQVAEGIWPKLEPPTQNELTDLAGTAAGVTLAKLIISNPTWFDVRETVQEVVDLPPEFIEGDYTDEPYYVPAQVIFDANLAGWYKGVPVLEARNTLGQVTSIQLAEMYNVPEGVAFGKYVAAEVAAKDPSRVVGGAYRGFINEYGVATGWDPTAYSVDETFYTMIYFMKTDVNRIGFMSMQYNFNKSAWGLYFPGVWSNQDFNSTNGSFVIDEGWQSVADVPMIPTEPLADPEWDIPKNPETGAREIVDIDGYSYLELLPWQEVVPVGNLDPGADPGTDPDPDPDPDPEQPENPPPPAGVFAMFPFCLPWDVAALVEALSAPPVEPRFEFDIFGGLFEDAGTIVLDFRQFEEIRRLVRMGFLILFVIGLLVATKSYIWTGGG